MHLEYFVVLHQMMMPFIIHLGYSEMTSLNFGQQLIKNSVAKFIRLSLKNHIWSYRILIFILIMHIF